MSGPRVLHVAQSAEYGLGRYLDDLMAAQARRGWPVAFAGPSRPVPDGVEHHRWLAGRAPGPAVAGEAWRLARLVRRVDPDVVHLHSSKAGLAGRLALRGRRRTIFQPHAWSFLAVEGRVRSAAVLWERSSARWAHVVVCGSEAERQQGEAVGVRPRAWRVVPNAVDVERFSPGDREEARRALGLPPGGRVVVCAGRLAVAQKGQDVLLRAWPSVVAAHPDALLVLVGDGPDRIALEAAAPSSARFVGEQHDMAPWFRAADVVVQPSRYETLSLSVLEAMACARPVVVSDAIGMREAVGDESAVVPRDDAAALAAAVTARLADPAAAEQEGRQRRARVVACYGSEAWESALLALTGEIAAR